MEDTRSSPLAPSKCKMNCDGATFAATQLAGVGVVIWNCIGQVAVTLSKRLPYPSGPLEIESIAMEEGVLFTQDVGVCEVGFECDSEIVCNALIGLSEPPVVIAKYH